MKNIIVLFAFFLWASIFSQAQTRHFVRPEALGQNNGSSWADAFTNLHDALILAMPSDEIWVAAGTYKPSESGNREVYFKMPSGVRLYGGFEGTEMLLEQRRWADHPSILDGDMGMPGNAADNTFNLLYAFQPDSNTLIDGFVFQNANANKSNVSFFALGANGGGLLMEGTDGSCYATVRNCRFQQNKARLLGGAVCVNGGDTGSAAPVFEHCDFVENSASGGGAVYRKGGSWADRPADFRDCRFERNAASVVGGAIFFRDTERSDTLDFQHCVFDGNSAVDRGSALAFASPRPKTFSNLHLRNCDFQKHVTGSDMLRLDVFFEVGNFNLTIDSCNFFKNGGNQGSGHVLVESEGDINIEIRNSTFYDNHSIDFILAYLGLDDNLHGKLIMNDVILRNNKSSGFAGNFDFFCTRLQIVQELSSIVSLTSKGISVLDKCFFYKSYIYPFNLKGESQSVISNSVFVDNFIEDGLEFGSSKQVVILNNIFRGNPATNGSAKTQRLKNCIIYGEIGNTVPFTYEDTLYFDHCLLSDDFELNSYLMGIPLDPSNLLNVDPMLMDTAAGDYRLQPCSPAVDAGNNAPLEALQLLTDAAGAKRIQGGRVDIGPYESPDHLYPVGTVVRATCVGTANGRIELSATGGCPPYRIRWSSNGAADTVLTGLSPGTYQLTITDAKGRSATTTATVPVSDPQANILGDSVVCPGATDARLEVALSGTEALPFQYLWSDGATDATRSGLSAGIYGATLTDGLGCRDTVAVTVQTARPPQLDTLITPASGANQSDGAIDLTTNGTLGPYSYLWSNGATTARLENLPPGVYALTLSDREGCIYQYAWRVRVVVPAPETPPLPEGFVRPNPANTWVQVGFQDSDTWQLFNASGIPVRTATGTAAGLRSIDCSDLPAGMYWYVFSKQGHLGKRGKLVLLK